MGTPCHTWHLQAQSKLYRLQTPASPFFRPGHYDLVGLDEFAMGTNAVVAVISYTVSTLMTERRIQGNGTVHIMPPLFGKYWFESWIYYLHLHYF
jgi:hypothetical protein